MKKLFFLLFTVCTVLLNTRANANPPSSCKPVVDGVAVDSLSLEILSKWCEGTPLVVQCDDGKKYTLNSFKVNFFTLKPLMNKEFGIGEGGIPYKAREAVSKGMVGDALVLKEVTATGPAGESISIQVLSFKIK